MMIALWSLPLVVMTADSLQATEPPPAVAIQSYTAESERLAQPSSAKPHVKPYEVEVDVRADGASLWSGRLRLAGPAPASYSSEVRQADPACPGAITGYEAQAQRSLRFTIRHIAYGETSDRVSVDVSWTRPGPACPPTRQTVTISGQLDLPMQGTRELRGDGSLIVTIRRR